MVNPNQNYLRLPENRMRKQLGGEGSQRLHQGKVESGVTLMAYY